MRSFLQKIFKVSQPSTSDRESDLESVNESSSTNCNNNRSKKSGILSAVVDRLTNIAQITESYRKNQVYHSGTSNHFYLLRNSSYSPHSIIGSDGFMNPSSFEKIQLPTNFIGISQILCVSSKIYVLEEGSGRVYVHDGTSEIGFMKPFDGTRYKVVAIRGDTYGMLFWVYDTQHDCFLLYGADQNHYDNIGTEITDPMTAVLVFDPRSDTSGTKIITHVECAYSLSFCVTNGVEIRCSGQIIWCRPNNTSTTWREVVFTTRAPIIDIQTHSFGFVSLLADSTICVGGSNNHHESMHDVTGSYLDIRYLTGLAFVPKQLFATSYTTIVKTVEDKFIEFGRGFANGNVQSGATGNPFDIISPNYSVVKDLQIDQIYLKGGMVVSFEQSKDLRFIYTEGGVNGVLKLSSLYSQSLISRGRIHCACNTTYFVFYEGCERGMSLDMGRKLLEIAQREDTPLCDVCIISRDASYVNYAD